MIHRVTVRSFASGTVPPGRSRRHGTVGTRPRNGAKCAGIGANLGKNGSDLCAASEATELPTWGGELHMLLAAEKGDISTIIGGIAPDWGPFGSLGNEARVMIE